MKTMAGDLNRTWAWYMRLRRYEWNGIERSRAVFGFGFWPEHHDFFLMTVNYVNALERDKKSPVKRSLGADLYRAMAGEPPEIFSQRKGNRNFKEYPPHSVIIDDITTDIDSQDQYDVLIKMISGN
jgi:hypothetical protein